MISVVVTGHVKRNMEGQFHQGMRAALKEAFDIPGLRYTKFARKFEDDGREQFILIGEYESSAAMHAAKGRPGSEKWAFLADLVEDYEVEMWEALDVEFDPETAEPYYVAPQPPAAAVAP